MNPTKPRLISPNRTRLYPNARTGAGVEAAGPIVKARREGLAQGEGDMMTWEALLKCGWKPYDGPAETDPRGYIVKGSDPSIS